MRPQDLVQEPLGGAGAVDHRVEQQGSHGEIPRSVDGRLDRGILDGELVSDEGCDLLGIAPTGTPRARPSSTTPGTSTTESAGRLSMRPSFGRMNEGRRRVRLAMTSPMISAALWSTFASADGSARRGSTGRSPGAPGLQHLDVGVAPSIVLLEVVAGRADDLGGPRQVFADVVVVDRRMEPQALDEQSGEGAWLGAAASVRRRNSGIRSLPSRASRIERNQVKWLTPAAWTSISARGRPRVRAQSSIASATL